jgi:hypothetical protein
MQVAQALESLRSERGTYRRIELAVLVPLNRRQRSLVIEQLNEAACRMAVDINVRAVNGAAPGYEFRFFGKADRVRLLLRLLRRLARVGC